MILLAILFKPSASLLIKSTNLFLISLRPSEKYGLKTLSRDWDFILRVGKKGMTMNLGSELYLENLKAKSDKVFAGETICRFFHSTSSSNTNKFLIIISKLLVQTGKIELYKT